MLEIIKKQRQDLLVGLADLYVQKENTEKQKTKIEEQIIIQRVAIDQCGVLLKEAEIAAQSRTELAQGNSLHEKFVGDEV